VPELADYVRRVLAECYERRGERATQWMGRQLRRQRLDAEHLELCVRPLDSGHQYSSPDVRFALSPAVLVAKPRPSGAAFGTRAR
jgi:hypothetical protein